MATRRTTRWVIAGAVVLATLLVVGIGGEVVARRQLTSRLAGLGEALPGVSVALTGRPALMQLAGGRVDVALTVSDDALNAYAGCRANQELTVRAVEGGLVVATTRTLRGFTVPVEVTLTVEQQGDRWLLVADSVSAAGISLPADRALNLPAGRGGTGSGMAGRLLSGIPLPSDEQLAITGVQFTDGAARVTASTPIRRTEGGPSSALSELRSCLHTQEG